jgi:hypothetical protein
MFKKKIVMLIAAALMTLSASSAFAAFGDLELIRVYYDRAGAEYATDLGTVASLTAAGANNTIAGSFTGVNGTASLVSYWALDRTTNQLWVSGSTSTPSVINGTSGGLTTTKSGTTNVYSLYNSTGGVTTAANTNSYKNKLSATQGYFGNAVNSTTRINTEASLTAMIAAGTGSVNQTLYFWNDGLTTVAANKIGVNVASISTLADGSTVITSNVTPTPIPPAFFLMGSGLLGMFGLRRKNKVA